MEDCEFKSIEATNIAKIKTVFTFDLSQAYFYDTYMYYSVILVSIFYKFFIKRLSCQELEILINISLCLSIIKVQNI